MIEPIVGLTTAQVGDIILAREAQVNWWEEARGLTPTYSGDTPHRYLFHDLVEALCLRSLLAPVNCTDIIPQRFSPLTEDIRDQMMEVRQILFNYTGHIRELTLYLGLEGEVIGSNGVLLQKDSDFIPVSVKQLEVLTYSNLLKSWYPSKISPSRRKAKWDTFLHHSEEVRRRGLVLPEFPLQASN